MIEGIRLKKVFKRGLFGNKTVVALNGVSLKVNRGETVALVGDSGSGKSTLGKILLMLMKPDEGKVIYNDVDLTKLKKRELRKVRAKMQYIPQNPEEALDPRWKLYDSISEPLKIHGIENDVFEIIKEVGLRKEHLNRYPHELSGGELQRAVIARALVTNPEFIVCDEPTSMLDLSTQASIVRLLMKLQKKMDLTMLFITHDFELAEFVADRVLVMENGKIKSTDSC